MPPTVKLQDSQEAELFVGLIANCHDELLQDCLDHPDDVDLQDINRMGARKIMKWCRDALGEEPFDFDWPNFVRYVIVWDEDDYRIHEPHGLDGDWLEHRYDREKKEYTTSG